MRRLSVVLALVASLALPASASTGTVRITVFAAASLTDVLPAIDRNPRYSFAGSDQLALQIRQGAPADVYAAASPKHPQSLYRERLVYRPVVLATNELVLIVPRSNPARIRSISDLRPTGVKLVVGQEGVPIGDYTRTALKRLGLSSVLRNVVSEEPDVRGILGKVALGEADAGFVYATDARAAGRRVREIRLPPKAQPKVAYEIAIIRSTQHLAAARAFVRRVLSPAGQAVLARHGFGAP